MKKLMLIFIPLSVIVSIIFGLYIISIRNKTLEVSEKEALNKIILDLKLDKSEVQIIPKNYIVIGDKYGLYYKIKDKHIEELWIHDVGKQSMPYQISHLKHLKKLIINNTMLTNMEEITKLINSPLEYLDLGFNKIQKITSLEKLTNLKYLNLEGNKINMLENLDLTLNEFRITNAKVEIVEKLENLAELKKINLRKNPFPCILPNIAEIQKLQGRNVSVDHNCK